MISIAEVWLPVSRRLERSGPQVAVRGCLARRAGMGGAAVPGLAVGKAILPGSARFGLWGPGGDRPFHDRAGLLIGVTGLRIVGRDQPNEYRPQQRIGKRAACAPMADRMNCNRFWRRYHRWGDWRRPAHRHDGLSMPPGRGRRLRAPGLRCLSSRLLRLSLRGVSGSRGKNCCDSSPYAPRPPWFL
jgi:hypothetical protein